MKIISSILLAPVAATLLTGCATESDLRRNREHDAIMALVESNRLDDVRFDAAQKAKAEKAKEEEAKEKEAFQRRLQKIKQESEQHLQELEAARQYTYQAKQSFDNLKVGMTEEQVKTNVVGFIRSRSVSDGLGGQIVTVTYGISNYELDDWYLTFVNSKLIRWFHAR